MLARCFVSCGLALASMTTLGLAQSPSPNGVKTLNPPGAISTGSDTWSVGARAGDLIFVAGMQGIDPVTNKLVDGNEARIRQAFLNLTLLGFATCCAESRIAFWRWSEAQRETPEIWSA